MTAGGGRRTADGGRRTMPSAPSAKSAFPRPSGSSLAKPCAKQLEGQGDGGRDSATEDKAGGEGGRKQGRRGASPARRGASPARRRSRPARRGSGSGATGVKAGAIEGKARGEGGSGQGRERCRQNRPQNEHFPAWKPSSLSPHTGGSERVHPDRQRRQAKEQTP